MQPYRQVRASLAVAALAVAVPSVVPAGASPATPTATPAVAAPRVGGLPSTAEMEEQILRLVNHDRALFGLRLLARNPTLDAYAREWAQRVTDGVCGAALLCHRSDLGAITTAAVGDWRWAGENAALNYSANAAHIALMNSSGHRDNILEPGADTIGVGVVVRPDGVIVVIENFADAEQTPPAPSDLPGPGPYRPSRIAAAMP